MATFCEVFSVGMIKHPGMLGPVLSWLSIPLNTFKNLDQTTLSKGNPHDFSSPQTHVVRAKLCVLRNCTTRNTYSYILSDYSYSNMYCSYLAGAKFGNSHVKVPHVCQSFPTEFQNH